MWLTAETSPRLGDSREPQRILLLAPRGSYRISAYCRAAAALGAEVVVASEGVHSLIPEAARGLQVDFGAPDVTLARIREAAARRPFDAVVATDDATVEMGSRAAQFLKLPGNSAAAARTARRKDLARAALASAGLPVPVFRRLPVGCSRAALPALPYPCVVKPLALSGSRGVIRADGPAELEAALQRVRAIVADLRDEQERGFVLVEEFLPGAEVAVEGILTHGSLRVLAVFDKPDPLDGPFFEETYYVTPSRLPQSVLRRIEARVHEACAAFGLREGPVHAELRVDNGEAWILEVAARTIGGDCARLLRFGLGRPLEELVLSNALGLGVEAASFDRAAGVLMIPTPGAGTLRRVEGVLAAREVPYIEDVEIAIREGYEVTPLPEGASYLGFVFARGPDPETVERALRTAHAQLNVVIAPRWRIETSPAAP